MKTRNMPKLILALALAFLSSCSKTEDNVPLTAAPIEVNVEKMVRKASLVNQEIPFRVVNEKGDDVTDKTTFYVNGELVEGSVFSSDKVGDFKVYGIYKDEKGADVKTQEVEFKVIIPKRKVVIEDYTGTWCGWCPKVIAGIEALKEKVDKSFSADGTTSNIAVVAIHEKGGGPLADPYQYGKLADLKKEFKVSTLPAARINRNTVWEVPEVGPYDFSAITAMAGKDTNIGIGVYSELDKGNLKVQVDVAYADGSEEGDKLVVYLLEDGLVNDQQNYLNDTEGSVFKGKGDPIKDFVHNEVLRKSLTGIFGNPIKADALKAKLVNFEMAVPADYNAKNLVLMAMIVDKDNNAKNAQMAHVGDDKPYE